MVDNLNIKLLVLVEYGTLTAILLQAIKDQQKEEDLLKKEIDTLKTNK
jgi:hypothetical protein